MHGASPSASSTPTSSRRGVAVGWGRRRIDRSAPRASASASTGRGRGAALLVRAGIDVVAVDDRPGADARGRGRRPRRRPRRGARRTTRAARRCSSRAPTRCVPAPGRARPPPGVRGRRGRRACRCARRARPRGALGRPARASPSPAPTARRRSPTLVTAMLRGLGRQRRRRRQHRACRSSTAIDDPTPTCSWSRRRRSASLHSERFRPAVGAVAELRRPTTSTRTASLDAYEAAKARIWARQAADDVAIGNADDPVVMRHLAAGAPPRSRRSRRPARRRLARRRRRARGPDGDELRRGRRAARAPCPTTSPTPWPRPRPRVGGGATLDGVRRRAARVPRASPTASRSSARLTACAGTTTRRRPTPHAAARRRVRRSTRSCSSPAAATRASTSGCSPTCRRARAGRGRHRRGARRGRRGLRGRAPGRHRGLDGRRGARPPPASPGRATPCCSRPAARSFDWYGSYGERGDDFARGACRAGRRGHVTTRAGEPAPGRRPAPAPGRPRRRPTAGHPLGHVLVAPGRLIAVLNLLGLVMVLSASSVVALDETGSTWSYFARQAAWAGIGVGRRCSCSLRVDRTSGDACGDGVLALSHRRCSGLVLVPGVGVQVNGATRWLGARPAPDPAVGVRQVRAAAVRRRPAGPARRRDARPALHVLARSSACWPWSAVLVLLAAQPRHHDRARRPSCS